MKGYLVTKQTQKTNSNKFLSDVISISDFDRNAMEIVLKKAAQLEKMPREDKAKILQNRVVASLFLEPSTRTRLSFETAAQNLGAKVITLSEPQASSLSKGETFSDTIQMSSGYADIIVVRHSIDGAARRAAEVSSKPIVNAGDGANQHPSQTLLDLYTIYKNLGKIDGLKIMMAGDLKYGRTVHSLMYALSHFKDVTVYLYAPAGLEMPKHIIEDTSKNLKIHESNNLEKFVPQADVIYATRIQKERFPDEIEYQKVKNAYVITNELIAKGKKGLKVMHPLPRITEIAQEVDSSPAALYFEQAANGIPVREALLSLLKDAGGMKQKTKTGGTK